jgi:large subunit ribosomal protein L12
MEYTYATCILNESGEEINEANLTAVLNAAGCQVQESRVKAIVAALEDIEVDGVTNVDPATVGPDSQQGASAGADAVSAGSTSATAASDSVGTPDGETSSAMDVVPPVDATEADANNGADPDSDAGNPAPDTAEGMPEQFETAPDHEV